MPSQQLSPRQSVAMGALFIFCGLIPILMATGVITPDGPTNGPPPPTWVPFCAGLMFVIAGVLVMIDFGLARPGPDGQLPPDTPLPIQIASLVLALFLIALFAAVVGWVAFGPGPRAFTTTLSMPFFTKQYQGGELPGRIAFGFGTVMLVMMFCASGVIGTRRLWREWRARTSPAAQAPSP
jgi:hypothetical protein